MRKFKKIFGFGILFSMLLPGLISVGNINAKVLSAAMPDANTVDATINTTSDQETKLKNTDPTSSYNISYKAFKGGSSNEVLPKNDHIRVYQPKSGNLVGGYVRIKSNTTDLIDSIYIDVLDETTTLGYVVNSEDEYTNYTANDITLTGNDIVVSPSTNMELHDLNTKAVSIFNIGSKQFRVKNIYVKMAAPALAEDPDTISVTKNGTAVDKLSAKSDASGLVNDLAIAKLLKGDKLVTNQNITWSSDNENVISFIDNQYIVGSYSATNNKANVTISATDFPQITSVVLPFEIIQFANDLNISGNYFIKSEGFYMCDDLSASNDKSLAAPLTINVVSDNLYVIKNQNNEYLDDNKGLKFSTLLNDSCKWKFDVISGQEVSYIIQNNSTDKYLEYFNNNFTTYSKHTDIVLEVAKNVIGFVQEGTLTKTEYYEGQSFDPTGLNFYYEYEGNEKGEKIEYASINWTPSELKAGTTKVVGKVSSYNFEIVIEGLTVSKDNLKSLTLDTTNAKTTFHKGENFSTENISIIAELDSGKVTDINKFDFSINGKKVNNQTTLNEIGSFIVTVSYKEFTLTKEYSIKVNRELIPVIQMLGDFNLTKNDGDTTTVNDFVKSKFVTKISGLNAAVKSSGKIFVEKDGVKIGASSKGSLTITFAGKKLSKVVVSAKNYGSDSSTLYFKDGSSTETVSKKLTAKFVDYTFDLSKKFDSFTIESASSKDHRLYVNKITVFSLLEESDATVKELRNFDSKFMMLDDYTENKGWCKDDGNPDHNYFAKALTKFNEFAASTRVLYATNDAFNDGWMRFKKWGEFNNYEVKLAADSSDVIINKKSSTQGIDSLNESLFDSDGTILLITFATLVTLSGALFVINSRRKRDLND